MSSLKDKESTGSIPKIPVYDRTCFYSISIPDLLADLLLIGFSLFISEELFSGNGLFFHLKQWQIVAMYSIVVLTLPWYLGYIYVRNSASYEKGVMKIFLWTFILMTLMILVNLIRLIFATKWEESVDLSGPDEFTAVFAMFLLVLGPMMCLGGAAAAYQSFSPEGDTSKKFNPDRIAASGALLVIALSIAFMIYILGLFPEGSGGWVVFVAFLEAALRQ